MAAFAQERAKSNALDAAASSEGARIFASTCAGCHGLDGRGGERAPDIVGKRDVQASSNAALAGIIRDGVPGTGMPSFRSLGTLKIEALVQRLRVLQGRDRSVGLSGSPEAGKILFFGKASCSQCHVIDGKGGFLGSDLSGYAQAKSTEQVRAAITNPNENESERSAKVVATTQGGKTFTGIARNEDNFSLQLQTLDGAFHFFDKSQLRSVEHRPESLMPSDYGSKLSGQELDNLVSYLVAAARNVRPVQETKTNNAKRHSQH